MAGRATVARTGFLPDFADAAQTQGLEGIHNDIFRHVHAIANDSTGAGLAIGGRAEGSHDPILLAGGVGYKLAAI